MTRALTQDEYNVLAFVVVDPHAWWAHAQAAPNIADPAAALAAKVALWRPEYKAALALGNYKTRAQREAGKA